MKIAHKLFFAVALLSVPAVSYVSSLYSSCYDEDEFRSRPFRGGSGLCNRERGSNRCNIDSDCCPGEECSAFGMCQPCG